MANSKQSKKRARQSVIRRDRTMSLRSKMRTAVKKARKAIAEGQLDAAKAAFKNAESVVDSMVSKKIVHKNTAARYKHRLNAHLKQLAA